MSKIKRCGPKNLLISHPDDGNAATGVPHVLTSTVDGASDALNELGTSARLQNQILPPPVSLPPHHPNRKEHSLDARVSKLRRPHASAGRRKALAEARGRLVRDRAARGGPAVAVAVRPGLGGRARLLDAPGVGVQGHLVLRGARAGRRLGVLLLRCGGTYTLTCSMMSISLRMVLGLGWRKTVGQTYPPAGQLFPAVQNAGQTEHPYGKWLMSITQMLPIEYESVDSTRTCPK